jgi:hypothetical protein
MTKIPRLVFTLIIAFGCLAPMAFVATTSERFTWRAYADPYTDPYKDPYLTVAASPRTDGFEGIGIVNVIARRRAVVNRVLLMVLGPKLFRQLQFGGVKLSQEQMNDFLDDVGDFQREDLDDVLSASDLERLDNGILTLDMMATLIDEAAAVLADIEAGDFPAGALPFVNDFMNFLKEDIEDALDEVSGEEEDLLEALMDDPDAGRHAQLAAAIGVLLVEALD